MYMAYVWLDIQFLNSHVGRNDDSVAHASRSLPDHRSAVFIGKRGKRPLHGYFDISGDAFDAWLTTSWGKANTRCGSAAQQACERRECGSGGVEQAAKSVRTEQKLHACRWILKQQNYAHQNSAHSYYKAEQCLKFIDVKKRFLRFFIQGTFFNVFYFANVFYF